MRWLGMWGPGARSRMPAQWGCSRAVCESGLEGRVWSSTASGLRAGSPSNRHRFSPVTDRVLVLTCCGQLDNVGAIVLHHVGVHPAVVL